MKKTSAKNAKNKYVKAINKNIDLSKRFNCKKNFLIGCRKTINGIVDFIRNKKNILFILNLIFVFILTNIIVCIEIKLKLYVKFEKVIEVCAMAIAYSGILIGLYYTNYNTLVTNRYNSASTEILKLINEIPILIKAVGSLISYIEVITSYVIIYTLNYIRIDYVETRGKIGFLIVVFIILGIVYITFQYQKTSSELIEYNNQFKLSEDLLIDIKRELYFLPRGYIDYIDVKNEILLDAQKIVENKIDKIRKIISYNLKCNEINAAFVEQINYLFNIIFTYYVYKRQIQYNSKWFPSKEIHIKYYEVDSITYDIANKTGTLPLNEETIEYNWFETLMFYGIYDMYSKLLRDKDVNSIENYLYVLREILPLYCFTDEGEVIFQTIKKQFDIFIMELPKMIDNKVMVASIYERFAVILEELALMIKRSILNIDYIATINDSLKTIKNQKENTLNRFINNPECYRLHLSCITESKNEGHIITVDKYMLSIVIESINKYFENSVELIITIFEYLYRVAKTERNANRIQTTIILYYMCINYIYRLRSIDNAVLEQKELIYNNYSIENNRIMDNRFEDVIKKDYGNIIKDFGDIIVQNSIEQLGLGENGSPDFYGYYVNVSVNYMLECINNNNFDEFGKVYQKYIDTILFYQEKVIHDVINKKYNDNFIVKVIMEPFIKYCQLSGVALIYGILTNDSKWTKLVNSEFKEFYGSRNGKEKISLLLKSLTVYKKLFVYSANDFDIYRACTNLVNDKISPYVISRGIYGEKYKTKDVLLNKFLNHKYIYKMELKNIEEFYIVKVINKKMSNKNRYKSSSGWEERNDD